MRQRADPPAAPASPDRRGPRRAGRRRPFVQPRVSVAVGDPLGGGEHLADVRALAVARAERPLERELELVVLKGNHLGPPSPTPARDQ